MPLAVHPVKLTDAFLTGEPFQEWLVQTNCFSSPMLGSNNALMVIPCNSGCRSDAKNVPHCP
ncbi:hypothetical protein TTRE_0000177201 [Trichuris trichiura]|uniref:Uncharacterized protein n=1 Tax=Trichuris trichiura TaxID=36087 RepID=A0A077YZG8_TRITR|nr:hypothetical protein TTRE_0000177201 [Trichuris trichiura]